MSWNWLSWIRPSPRNAERAEMLALLQRVRRAERASPLSDHDQISTFIVDIIADACERYATLPGVPLGGGLYAAIETLLQEDAFIGEIAEDSVVTDLTLDEGVRLRAALKRRERFLQSRGGRLAADIQAVVAADFIRNLRDEVKKGFQGRLRQGLYPLPAPLGYKDQGRGLPKIPDPLMAPLVQQAFRLYASTQYNLYTLGKEMHQAGLRNRRGGIVSRNGLSTMLGNQFYMGIIHIASTGESYQGIHEPLIKKSLFDQVQDVLHGRTKNTGLKHDFRYRKTLRCVHCKYSLIPERQKGRVYYRCQTRNCPRACVREDFIDAQMKEILDSLWIPNEEIVIMERELSHLQEERFKRSKELLNAAELNVANVDVRIDRLTDAYIDRMIDKTAFEERKQKLLLEKANAQESLNALRTEFEEKSGRTQIFLELIKAVSLSKDRANEYENRDLLKSVTSNFQVDGKKLIVNWKIPFEAVAFRTKSPYGEPYRATSRTFKKASRVEIKKIFNLIHGKEPPIDTIGNQTA